MEKAVNIELQEGVLRGSIRDVSGRSATQAILDAQKEALEMLVADAALKDVLVYLTSVVENLSNGNSIASILLLDNDNRLRNGASPSLPDDYIRAIDGISADVNVGTCSAAAATGKVIITPDIASDVKWVKLSHLLLEFGLKSAWSMPILARDGKVLGTFGTYFRELRQPDAFETQVVEILARTAALAIERKDADERLKQAEERLRAIFESSHDGILVEEADTIVYVNPSYTREFGYGDAAELTGRHISIVISPEDAGRLIEYGHRRVRGLSAPSQYEFKGRRKDGTLIDVEASVSQSMAGDHIYTTTMVRYITERKRAEMALRKSENQLRLVTDTIPMLVSFVDSDLRYGFVNRAYSEWFEIPCEAVVGKHLSEVLGEEAYRSLLPEIERVLSGEEVFFERTVPYRTGSRSIQVNYIPQRDEAAGGRVTGFHAFVRDISEQKAAAIALERSRAELEDRVIERTRELASANEERISILHRLVDAQENERGRMARDVHDQLGQQMTVLRLKLESIKKSLAAGGEIGQQFDELREIARHLDNDVDSLAWKFRPAVLDDIGIVAALDQYVKQWSQHFTIASNFSSRGFGDHRLDPQVETNIYRITQEALNNIAKHANAKQVNVILERRGGGSVLIVEDDGSGFTLDVKRSNGKGMGLIGMRERAALIGGTFEVESTAGQGTTIYVKTPGSPPKENDNE